MFFLVDCYCQVHVRCDGGYSHWYHITRDTEGVVPTLRSVLIDARLDNGKWVEARVVRTNYIWRRLQNMFDSVHVQFNKMALQINPTHVRVGGINLPIGAGGNRRMEPRGTYSATGMKYLDFSIIMEAT